MIVNLDIYVSGLVPKEDREKLGRKAIFDDLAKQIMESGFVEIQEQEQEDGSTRYYCGVTIFSKDNVDKINRVIKRYKIKL